MTNDRELEAFKTEIDLRAFAADDGYALDRKESWCGSSVMRHANGDKVVVKRDHDGHYVYFSIRDERDNGSMRCGSTTIPVRACVPSAWPSMLPVSWCRCRRRHYSGHSGRRSTSGGTGLDVRK